MIDTQMYIIIHALCLSYLPTPDTTPYTGFIEA